MSNNVKIEVLPIADGATPDPNNVNKHTQRGQTLLQNSLRKRGAFRSIASAGKDAETPVIYAGNLTHEMAVDAGFTEIVNVHVTGTQLVNVVRDDIAPGSPEAIALGLEDNEIGKQSYQPDIDVIAALCAGENAVLMSIKKQDSILCDMINGIHGASSDYTRPNFDSIIETFDAPQGDRGKSEKDGNWLYVEFYGQDETFNAIMERIKPYMKSLHQIDSEFFHRLTMTISDENA